MTSSQPASYPRLQEMGAEQLGNDLIVMGKSELQAYNIIMKRICLVFTDPQKVSHSRRRAYLPRDPGRCWYKPNFRPSAPAQRCSSTAGISPAIWQSMKPSTRFPGALLTPLRYGYSAVGRVIALGPGVDPAWKDRLVFSFQPHASHFISAAEALMPVPAGISA